MCNTILLMSIQLFVQVHLFNINFLPKLRPICLVLATKHSNIEDLEEEEQKEYDHAIDLFVEKEVQEMYSEGLQPGFEADSDIEVH